MKIAQRLFILAAVFPSLVYANVCGYASRQDAEAELNKASRLADQYQLTLLSLKNDKLAADAEAITQQNESLKKQAEQKATNAQNSINTTNQSLKQAQLDMNTLRSCINSGGTARQFCGFASANDLVIALDGIKQKIAAKERDVQNLTNQSTTYRNVKIPEEQQAKDLCSEGFAHDSGYVEACGKLHQGVIGRYNDQITANTVSIKQMNSDLSSLKQIESQYQRCHTGAG